jgi:hypothetical protein
LNIATYYMWQKYAMKLFSSSALYLTYSLITGCILKLTLSPISFNLKF